MIPYVHLHVHSHYSLLDGQADVTRIIDKAIADGMRGVALTDHGNMMGIKDLFNYSNKVKGGAKKAIAQAQKKIDALRDGTYTPDPDKDGGKSVDELVAECEATIAQKRIAADFKPVIGCEMYCARRKKELKDTKEDASGWHLIVLAKNEVGYHNLIKLVSRSWVDGYYYRPRTDKEDLELFHEGLIVCTMTSQPPRKRCCGSSACLAKTTISNSNVTR